MAIYEDVLDKKGWKLGDNFFVHVKVGNRKGFKGWVEGWDGKILTIRNERTGGEHSAVPENCTVTAPTTYQKANRIGQGKTVAEATKQAKRNRRVRTPKWKPGDKL